MTLSGYTEAGGVRGAIAHTAETVFRQRLTPAQQPIARMIFTRLAELDDDAQDTRRRASFSELITRSTDAATIDAVLAILTEARLVITGTLEPGSVQVIEVAHEALIREWPTLRQWLNENRAGLLLHQKLADDAAEWLRLEKDPGALYRGLRLEQAAAFSEQNLSILSLEEQDFLDASRQAAAEEAGRERRYRSAGQAWRAALPALGILLSIGLGIFFYVSKLYVQFLTPLKMNSGAFNIAVAEFGQIGADGVDRSWAEGGSAISTMTANALKKEMQADPNLLVWQDSPALADHNTRIGRAVGSSPAARMAWAEQAAKRLNADMLVFGNLEIQDPSARLVLQVYIAPNYNYQFEDIQGSFQQGAPIGITNPTKPGLEAEPPVTSQASTFAWLAIGLTRMRLGQPAQALEAFRKAETFSPDWAVIQFFIGRESLFLSDRDPARQEALTGEALQAFQKALGLDPQDARSEIGLGSVYFAQAKRLVAAVPDGSSSDERLARAAELAVQARQAYGRASDLPLPAQGSAIPLKEVAQLGVGTTLRLEGEIQYRQGQEQQARQTLQHAVQVLQTVQSPFEKALQQRYLAQSFEALGTAYQWLGFLDERGGDFSSAQKNYSEAVKQYNDCAQLAKQSPDLILSRDIVDQQCVPYRNDLQKRLDALKGNS
jgi:tetratricopeptide (TPR) repeat protein